MRRSRRGALLVCLVLVGCRVSPEERVRARIESVVAALEGDNPAVLGEFVSRDYRDERGRDRAELLSLASAYVRSSGDLHVAYRVLRIEVTGRSARVRLLAAAAEIPFEWKELGRTRADLLRFDLELVREGRDWRLVSASWEPASPADFLLTRYGPCGDTIAIL